MVRGILMCLLSVRVLLLVALHTVSLNHLPPGLINVHSDFQYLAHGYTRKADSGLAAGSDGSCTSLSAS